MRYDSRNRLPRDEQDKKSRPRSHDAWHTRSGTTDRRLPDGRTAPDGTDDAVPCAPRGGRPGAPQRDFLASGPMYLFLVKGRGDPRRSKVEQTRIVIGFVIFLTMVISNLSDRLESGPLESPRPGDHGTGLRVVRGDPQSEQWSKFGFGLRQKGPKTGKTARCRNETKSSFP